MKDREDQSPDKIRQVAMHFDKAVESGDIEAILSGFTDDCEIELLGIKLRGREGVKKWLNWLYKHIAEIKFIPVTIMVDGDTFFEEFVVKAKLHNGAEAQSRQAEVLVYEDYKIRSLRLYFDRLDFADSVAKGIIGKTIVRQLTRASLKDLK
jgi:ketosteroid isomerase-like protein